MLRPWISLILLICCCQMSQARQADEVGGYFDDATGVQPYYREPELKPAPVKPRPKPVRGQAHRKPTVAEEEADSGLPTTGQPFKIEGVTARDMAAPVFEPFKKLFQQCAPAGCTAGQAHICRGQNCHTHKGSCHHSGEAVDLMSIRCNGKLHNAYHPKYLELVKCVQDGKRMEGVPGREGKLWRTIFRQGEAQNSGCGRVTPLNETDCHWDHAHFSITCRRGNRWSW